MNIQYNTCIGLEKNNDDARRNFHSSNKWDGAKEIILADYRLEELGPKFEREPRYEKIES